MRDDLAGRTLTALTCRVGERTRLKLIRHHQSLGRSPRCFGDGIKVYLGTSTNRDTHDSTGEGETRFE